MKSAMSDQQGVYISVATQSPTTKVLISTSRDTWAECKQDLRDIFGDEFAENVAEVGAGSRPVLTVVKDDVPLTAEQAAAALGGTAGQEQTFETCSCGYLKDRWVPPGVAKGSGKTYPGFFGCSNPVRHR